MGISTVEARLYSILLVIEAESFFQYLDPAGVVSEKSNPVLAGPKVGLCSPTDVEM